MVVRVNARAIGYVMCAYLRYRAELDERTKVPKDMNTNVNRLPIVAFHRYLCTRLGRFGGSFLPFLRVILLPRSVIFPPSTPHGEPTLAINSMLNRTAIVLSLVFFATTVMAGSGLPKPTCHTCTVRVSDCKKVCNSPGSYTRDADVLTPCVELS